MQVALVNNLHFNSLLDFDLHEVPDKLRLSTPPLGLLLLGAILGKEGHNVSVVDFGGLAKSGAIPTTDDFYPEAARYLAGIEPDCVGFTTRCDNYHCVARIAGEFKRISPATPIVFGGPQATVTDIDSLKLFPFLDFVVRNEGEETFPELLNQLGGKRDFGSVASLSWRKGGEPIGNPARPLIRDLDAYPIPAYHLYQYDFNDR
ncbi:MAG TPA: cobalamin-dependent protein, partial [Blastocatellia bacterium]|nr:cobalamin-dependent protein [Blastocatellia bacterium]